MGKEKLVCRDGRTRQSDAAGVDVNRIMARYARTGELPIEKAGGVFMDCTKVPDFAEANNLLIRAQESFMGLPAKLRARFDNDPLKMVAFCADKGNRKEMEELGLVRAPKPPEQPTVEPSSTEAKAKVS